MYLDKEAMFSDKQAVTATAVADHTVDIATGDIGPSEGVSLFVSATTPYTGSGTLDVEIQTADEVNATTGALVSPVTVAAYLVSNAALKAGGKLVGARLPHGMKRYAGLNYKVGGTISGGTITAGLTWDVQSNA